MPQLSAALAKSLSDYYEEIAKSDPQIRAIRKLRRGEAASLVKRIKMLSDRISKQAATPGHADMASTHLLLRLRSELKRLSDRLEAIDPKRHKALLHQLPLAGRSARRLVKKQPARRHAK